MAKKIAGARGALFLMLAALIWGTAFVAQSLGMDHTGPCTFTGARSFIGALVLLPVVLLSRRLPGRKGQPVPQGSFWKRNGKLLGSGALCGVLLGSGSLLQQAGIQFTTAGKAGFLTALYIVIVPVLGIFLGRRPGAKVWIGVMIALVGAYLLSVTTGEAGGLAIGPGDLLVLLSAVFFSLHILTVDRVAGQLDGVALSCVQFFVAGVLSTVLALFLEKPDFSGLLQAWGPLLYTGVLSSGVAYTLQILGQQRVQPTVASLILSLESVFAAVAGWIVLQEPLSPREIAGCVLVFAAVVLAQLPDRKQDAIPAPEGVGDTITQEKGT